MRYLLALLALSSIMFTIGCTGGDVTDSSAQSDYADREKKAAELEQKGTPKFDDSP